MSWLSNCQTCVGRLCQPRTLVYTQNSLYLNVYSCKCLVCCISWIKHLICFIGSAFASLTVPIIYVHFQYPENSLWVLHLFTALRAVWKIFVTTTVMGFDLQYQIRLALRGGQMRIFTASSKIVGLFSSSYSVVLKVRVTSPLKGGSQKGLCRHLGCLS